jgi:hypothetical protein
MIPGEVIAAGDGATPISTPADFWTDNEQS